MLSCWKKSWNGPRPRGLNFSPGPRAPCIALSPGAVVSYLPSLVGKTFYRLAMMPLMGPMRIRKLTTRLQNPEV